MATTSEVTRLAPNQSHYIVERLLQDGRISPTAVSGYLADLAREILQLEARLEALRAATAEGVGVHAPTRSSVAPRRKPGRPRTSAAAEAPVLHRARQRRASPARKLQGSYMGYFRQLPERDRARFQKMRQEQGIEAAIAAIRARLGK